MKFLKQFLSELTQTGGRFGARDFDLNQTRGKHSSSLNFPFAKACPLLVLLAAEVAAPTKKRSRFHHSLSLYPPSFLYLSTPSLLFPPTFFPPAAISSLSFPRRRPAPRSSEVSQVRPSIWSQVGEEGRRIRIKRTDCRKLVVESPTRSYFPSTPAYVFSFYPFFPSRLSWFYSRPLPPSRPSSRDATEEKGPRDRNRKILKGLEREREPPFDHRFAAAREIAVFFAPDGKWPRFCPSVFFFCQLLLARLSIVRCIRCQSSRSSNNISNQLSEEDSTKN